MSPIVETERLTLTIPPPDAAPRLLAFAVDNEQHLAQWEPSRPEGYFTETFWRRRLERDHEERRRDLSLRLCILQRDEPNGPILGHANFSNIVRGAFMACYLGYSLDHRWVGRGVMSEALAGAIPYAFGPLGLHRIMANYVPTNERSGKLLRKLGFTVEGYARDYLFIHGAWRDHVLTSLTTPRSVAPDADAPRRT